MSNPKDDSKDIKELINAGSDIAGNAIGAGVGFLISGPEGAVIGGISAPLLKYTFLHLASEIKNRVIGEREKVRIGATIAFAAEKIQENLEKGLKVRQDDFFEKKMDERADADEILEGILLAAQREYQEKKLHFYGNLVANIAFYPDIDSEQANFLIKLAGDISYRQLCLLNLFVNKNKYNLREERYGTKETGAKIVLLLQEIYDLDSYGILNHSGAALLGVGNIIPAKINVQGAGALLYNLMELWTINTQEINQLADLLK
ncbi:hypothetical protein [Methanobacterium oryzae]|uniref:hypothetical protein n=1 Tax=Methanobacterium oryzae TaxID=69540 RepID=UPI003D2374DF